MSFDEVARGLAAVLQAWETPRHRRISATMKFVRASCERDGLPEWLTDAVMSQLIEELVKRPQLWLIDE